ncbi:hypothetical protein M9458_041949, partial [Cirrhinus mrigala]
MDDSNAVKLFVGNLDLETTQDDLIALFAPYGEVVHITVLRQFAFVHLQGEGAADSAIRDLNGRENPKGGPSIPPKYLWVTYLYDLFSAYGK